MVMEIVSTGPFRAASLLWQPRPGFFVLTVVCKATYTLLPAASALAHEQDAPNEVDDHWNDDERRSLHAASDLVPFKARADVFLVGHAYAPQKQPTSSLTVRMIVGDVDKSIEVHADRAWTQDRKLREAARFTRIPLRYERAGGGPLTSNPAGMRPDAPPDRYGQVPVPNLQPPGYHVARPEDAVPPIGLGPIAPGWPGRQAKLSGQAAGWDHRTGLKSPLPQGLDPGFFNAAPPDQQTGELRGNERIVLENLHPEYARLVTSLPGITPRATVEREGQAPADLVLRCDTLSIDVDRGLCALVWRGQLPLTHAAERGRVVVRAEAPEATPADDRVTQTLLGSTGVSTATLPFTPDAAPGPILDRLPAPAPVLPRENDATATVLAPAQAPRAALPFVAPGAAAAPPAPRPPPAPPPPPIRPLVEPSAWAAVEARPDRLSIGQSVLAEEKAAAERRGGETAKPREPAGPAPAAAAASEPRERSVDEGAAPAGSALAASNAAARAARVGRGSPPTGAAAAPEPAPTTRVDVVDLLWFDRASLPRIRKRPEWRAILQALEDQPPDPDLDDVTLGSTPAEVEDRRDVFEILARGEAIAVAGVEEALAGAIRKDGKMVPPLVLVTGTLVFPRDEIEALRAHVALISPLSVGDEKLRAEIALVKEYLSTPDLTCAPQLVETLSVRLWDAFNRGKRAVSAEALRAYADAALLKKRRLQERDVLGGSHLRAVLQGPAQEVPAYLPAAAGSALPVYPCFRARVVAEVHLPVDRDEEAPAALRVVALARVWERAASTTVA